MLQKLRLHCFPFSQQNSIWRGAITGLKSAIFSNFEALKSDYWLEARSLCLKVVFDLILVGYKSIAIFHWKQNV